MTLLFIPLGLIASFILGFAAGFAVHRRPFVQSRDGRGRFRNR